VPCIKIHEPAKPQAFREAMREDVNPHGTEVARAVQFPGNPPDRCAGPEIASGRVGIFRTLREAKSARGSARRARQEALMALRG
jgi:hypothetical protein